MENPTTADLAKFMEYASHLRPLENGCMRMAPTFIGVERRFRAYKMYWYSQKGFWPGNLKKTCDTDGCVTHYEEKGHILTAEQVEEIRWAEEYWGASTDLAKKYGVSKARISQIRSTRNAD